jgi:16S rRNA (adenine1518-N6/adenine1519-N6)-dimethyltransferase
MQKPRKRFGQHFLHDSNVIDRIIRAIDPQEDDRLVEIGPGQGALTFPLLEKCKRLIAIELDRDLVPLLQEKATNRGVLEVINADILKFDLHGLANTGPCRIVGNLPYNISTPLMFHLLNSISLIQDMHFMVQKEVAQRIVAVPGKRDYGRLSVMIQYHCQCQYLFDVAPGSFTPPPRVDSAVIRMTPYPEPAVSTGSFQLFSEIVKAAFNQRRKTIANSLKAIVATETFESCGIDSQMRAENLSLQDFASLTRTTLKLINDQGTSD